MATNVTKGILSNFTYEIIERIVRFISHLEEIERQFYSNNQNKSSLIENYKGVLKDLLKETVNCYREVDEHNLQSKFERLTSILSLTNKLYRTKIAILPRPKEPLELTRFERVIEKQIVVLTKEIKKNISISMNEELGEGVQGDYLLDFKEEMQKVLNLQTNEIEKETSNGGKLHITIPRIDASNPFRWPSLIHEMAHTLFLDVYHNSEDESDSLEKCMQRLLDEYKNTYTSSDASMTDEITAKWLLECWCDLFACILIGPSFYFSQYIAFINSEEIENSQYPPNDFRLNLIESIIRHRFPKDLCNNLDSYFEECETLIDYIQKTKNILEYNLVLNNFNDFFTSYFFSNPDTNLPYVKGHNDLSQRLTELIQKFYHIQVDVIDFLSDRLKDQLPIPSIKTTNSNGEYEEFPTYIQEIFLAGWVSKCKDLKQWIFNEINKLDDQKDLYIRIKTFLYRHDQAILKSIQVSEWFDMLMPEPERPQNISIYEKKPKPRISKGMIIDKEIKSLIYSDELKIIPLMYMNRECKEKKLSQIGTSSLDIRLGTCFQRFYPNEYGIIDFVESNEDKDKNSKSISERIDLDLTQGITITPGQFLLAHSMEYVKLPNYLCGNLEGRSSFARLGIEIHMTAGFIDPGFEGVITFEIYNAGPTTVKLYPGMRVGQLRFEKCNKPDEPYNKKDVKYKGLLEHNLSMQNKDIEVKLMRDYKEDKFKPNK